MKELGYVLSGLTPLLGFIYFVIWDDIEIKNRPRADACVYAEYHTVYDTCKADALRISGNKKIAQGSRLGSSETVSVVKVKEKVDPFKSIRQTWQGCGACHGQNGEGSVGPKLSGQSSEYIVTALNQYKNKQKRGRQSQMMYGQAGALTARQIEMIGDFVQTELK